MYMKLNARLYKRTRLSRVKSTILETSVNSSHLKKACPKVSVECKINRMLGMEIANVLRRRCGKGMILLKFKCRN